jgi:sec-independent protein translocase protein TatA
MNPLFGVVGFDLLSPFHLMIILGLGVLLFGKRLPEIGRSLGKGIVEFKKGLKGLEDEVEMNSSVRHESPSALEPPRPPQRVTATAPKFEDAPTPPVPPPQS